MTKKTLALLLILLLSAGFLQAQEREPFPAGELRLKSLLDSIRSAPDEHSRLRLNETFTQDLKALLEEDGSFRHPFDSLRGITLTPSPDGRFRLFTWPLAMDGGRFRYTGLLQTAPEGVNAGRTFLLTDLADSLDNGQRAVLRDGSWYGSVCYQVVPVGLPNHETAYTLLTWRGESLVVSSRLIDVLSFDPGGKPVFGRRIFFGKEPLPDARLIFRYSARASMVLRYEKQAVIVGKTWNAARKEFRMKRIRKMMIVLDRIVPMDPRMEGNYEYYIPAGDVMDGYVFEGGSWKLVTGIDARNPAGK